MKVTHTVGENGELYERWNIQDYDKEITGTHTVVTSQLCEVIHKLEAEVERMSVALGAQTKLWPDDD